MSSTSDIGSAVQRLCVLMEQLRSPAGCPWDAAQTHATLQAYLIEEAYEVIEAITSENRAKLCEELGDLLLQIVFHAQIGAEAGNFTLADVADAIAEKLISRHPHVFATDRDKHDGPHEEAWDQIKQRERRAAGDDPGVLSGVPRSLPALQRAQKVLSKTSRYGLPIRKLLETRTLIDVGSNPDSRSDHHPALQLIHMVLEAQENGIDLEQTLRDATRAIEHRFSQIERLQGSSAQDLRELTAEEWCRLWDAT